MDSEPLPKPDMPDYPADLPPALVSLVRQILRDCAAPGIYTITLEVPPHKRRPRTATISRLERIRILEIRMG